MFLKAFSEFLMILNKKEKRKLHKNSQFCPIAPSKESFLSVKKSAAFTTKDLYAFVNV